MDKKDIFSKVNKDNFLGATLDENAKQLRVYTNDMLINKIKRDSKKIEDSFDLLCGKELCDISLKYSKALYIIGDGYIRAVNTNDKVGIECRDLLFNAMSSVTASVDILRRGYILQPGMILRSTIETFSLISYIKLDKDGFANYKTAKFDINKLIKYGKQVLPFIGQFQGYLSNQFVHISSLHSENNNVIEYTELNEPLKINLDLIRLSIIIIHIISEVVYPFTNSYPCTADCYSVESNMAHEFGHVIGLSHSSSTTAVMYAYFSKGEDRSVGTDDENGYNNIDW